MTDERQYPYGKRWGRLDPYANEGLRECDYVVSTHAWPSNCIRQPRWRDRKTYHAYCTEHKRAVLAFEKAKEKAAAK